MPWMLGLVWRRMTKKTNKRRSGKKNKMKQVDEDSSRKPSMSLYIGLSIVFLVSLPSCLVLCRILSTPSVLLGLANLMPDPMIKAVNFMLPLSELRASYDIVKSFAGASSEGYDQMVAMLKHLLFVTFHIQMGTGHIGIAFLTAEQRRKNMLIRMDVDEKPINVNGAKSSSGKIEKKFDPSRKFRRSAPSFILFTVLPYMFQIILFGNLNNYSFMYVRNEIHRSVRVKELFEHDSHLTALANDSATSPDVYASAMDTVVSTSYDIFNRKLFSLPKLLILPGVIARQPMLLVKIFPMIFVTDVIKGRIVASVTDRVEEFQREAREVNSIRQKVEQFDMKNAELLRRSGLGATAFTQRRWDDLTQSYQAKMAAGDLLKRTRGFYMWLQRNFVFVVLIDCALARLLAEGSIVVSEIFVFSRAIEDVVDLLLIRSRSESELATLMTQIDKLKVLDDVWSKSKEARLLPCQINTENDKMGRIVLSNLQYSRGTASVSMEQLVVKPGIYAVTGANGSGKSTLFRLLMACQSNERPIDLHESIELATPLSQWNSENKACDATDGGGVCDANSSETSTVSDSSTKITMPSADIVEISQTFYWPLYSKPIDWIYQKHISSDKNESRDCVRRVAEELQSLDFAQPLDSDKDLTEEERSEAIIDRLSGDLQDEKEDWFGELSGGQKSKVELVRKVFLRDHCPSVLLVDETMAPLDPASKSHVMAKLKEFCHESVVLVIYHTDVNQQAEEDDTECVPSTNFFDHNLHVENKRLTTRPVC